MLWSDCTLSYLLWQVRSKPKSLIAVVTEGCEPVQCYSIGERLKTISVEVPRLPQAAVKVKRMLIIEKEEEHHMYKSITHTLNINLSARWRCQPSYGSLLIKRLKSDLWEFVHGSIMSAGQLNQISLVSFLLYLEPTILATCIKLKWNYVGFPIPGRYVFSCPRFSISVNFPQTFKLYVTEHLEHCKCCWHDIYNVFPLKAARLTIDW